MPPALWTHLPTPSPTTVTKTRAPITAAFVRPMNQWAGRKPLAARPNDVDDILRYLEADLGGVKNGQEPEVPSDEKTDGIVKPELCPLVNAALERHSAVEIDDHHRRGEVKKKDRAEPEDDVRRALFGGNADPRQADDEQDLGKDKVGQAELFLNSRLRASTRSSSWRNSVSLSVINLNLQINKIP